MGQEKNIVYSKFIIVDELEKDYESVVTIALSNKISPEFDKARKFTSNYIEKNSTSKAKQRRLEHLILDATLSSGMHSMYKEWETLRKKRKKLVEKDLSDEELKFIFDYSKIVFILKWTCVYINELNKILYKELNNIQKRELIWMFSKAIWEKDPRYDNKLWIFPDFMGKTFHLRYVLNIFADLKSYKNIPNKKYLPKMFDNAISLWFDEGKHKYIAIEETLELYKIPYDKAESFRKAFDKYLKSKPPKKSAKSNK